MTPRLSRRALLTQAALAAAWLGLPAPPVGRARQAETNREPDPDRQRLADWTGTLRTEGLAADPTLTRAAVRVGELAAGAPYEAGMLDRYLRAGGVPPPLEPLTLSLTRFDCVTLVEGCLAVARSARAAGEPSWERFGREVERMRYRGAERRGYASRLHYFSEWISDGASRGLVRDLGGELGGVEDVRPLRFMTDHRANYPALSNDAVFRQVEAMERRLDGAPRRVVPAGRIAEVAGRIETGDVLAFATTIPGLDVTHTAFAYQDRDGILRVLHAPLSGGVVEITASTLPQYVAAIRGCTGVLVARPSGAAA